MRKRDKLRVITEANLRLELNYLKSRGLIKENYQLVTEDKPSDQRLKELLDIKEFMSKMSQGKTSEAMDMVKDSGNSIDNNIYNIINNMSRSDKYEYLKRIEAKIKSVQNNIEKQIKNSEPSL